MSPVMSSLPRVICLCLGSFSTVSVSFLPRTIWALLIFVYSSLFIAIDRAGYPAVYCVLYVCTVISMLCLC